MDTFGKWRAWPPGAATVDTAAAWLLISPATVYDKWAKTMVQWVDASQVKITHCICSIQVVITPPVVIYRQTAPMQFVGHLLSVDGGGLRRKLIAVICRRLSARRRRVEMHSDAPAAGRLLSAVRRRRRRCCQ